MSTTQIWTNIIAYVLQIGLLVGIGATLPVLLRLSGGGRAPAARLLYWQVLLVACLALPWVRPWHREIIAVTAAPIAAVQNLPHVITSAAASRALPSITEMALWLLGAGVAVRLILLAFGLLKLARYRRHGCAMSLPSEWTGMADGAVLLISDEVSGPVTFGLFRPVVLLPQNYPSMPESMRNAILFHELLHVERGDWLYTFGEELLRAVFWFHPAIWWVLGEIQLAREQTVDQAVIEMTQARDPYVDTLLAIAGVTAELDLAPAPLFLRRRHLKQRVMEIVQEGKMSKTRMIVAQATALASVALAGWVITGAIPMQAQAQMMSDGAGVKVNLNGSQLMHRSPVMYPAEALTKGVSGTVVVQVRLDANGEVIDDAILSGPDELRRGVQQIVLGWHFDKSAGGSTRVVNIDFAKPADPTVAPGPAVPSRVQLIGPIPAPINSPSEAQRAASAALMNQIQAARVPQETVRVPQSIGDISVIGLSDSAQQQLLATLPLHSGDAWSPEAYAKTQAAVQAFDSHLSLRAAGPTPNGAIELRIAAPMSIVNTGVGNTAPPQPLVGEIPPGAQRVGGDVMGTKLVNVAKPVYPPLAKLARQQGTVKFQALVEKDGTIGALTLISGPPLLVQAATDAVRQWAYSPTILNGAPVQVVTVIDVNFSLLN